MSRLEGGPGVQVQLSKLERRGRAHGYSGHVHARVDDSLLAMGSTAVRGSLQAALRRAGQRASLEGIAGQPQSHAAHGARQVIPEVAGQCQGR